MDLFQSYFEANKDLWNKRTPIHEKSEFYQLDEFRNGKSSLNKIELDEVGDVTGKKLLHLQCHFGLDTLSWVRLGAIVTGVDFSEESISLARRLNDEQQLKARFINCNIYDLKENLEDAFDIVFTSYGVIGWLPDIDKWAATITHFLKPGGIFYMAEFHPVIWMFDNDFEKITYPYHIKSVIEEIEGTYADRSMEHKEKSYSWNHSLSEVINALIGHGLKIQFLNEYPYSPYNCFNKTIQGSDGFWRISGMEDLIPMVYTIKAIKE